MNRLIPHDALVRMINDHSKNSLECRQVAKRLRELLPTRLAEIVRHKKQRKAAERLRHALTDPQYLQCLEEYAELQHQARQARMQYETHLMLVYARQSIRAHRRP